MPELPDLETIREVLAPRLTGQTINDVEAVRPLVVRDLTLEREFDNPSSACYTS